MVGVYCIAKTKEGDYLCEMMDKPQIEKVRESSPAKDSAYGPWKNYPEEMWKKVCIKRASKTWPKTDKTERLSSAVEILNQHEGIEFDREHTDDQWNYYQMCINAESPMPEELFIFWNTLEYEEQASLIVRHKKTIPRGKKGDPGSGKANETDRIVEIREHGERELTETIAGFNACFDDTGIEIFNELSQEVQAYVIANVNSEANNAILNIQEAA